MNRSAILHVTFVFLFFASCENKNETQSTKSLDITSQCTFKESFIGNCFYGIAFSDYEKIVISDAATYKKFEDSIRAHPTNINCDTAHLTQLDFNKYTLIGKHTSGGGCSAQYDRQLIDYKDEKKIVYKIQVAYDGECKMLIGSWNWVLIPKLQPGYVVEVISN